MIPGWLQLKQTRYRFIQLKAGVSKNHLTPFEQATLAFCHEWLSGKKSLSLQTSGSTGTPKKITLKRSQMETSARNTARALQLRKGGTALLCLDPQYIAGKMMLVRSFVTGMNVIAIEPSANPLKTISPRTKIDFAALVPYQLRATLNSPADKKKLNRLTAVIIGGAELDPTLKQQLNRLKPAVYATYGMTETISHIALQKINVPGARNYFQTMPGITVQKDRRGCLTIQAKYLGRKKIITNDLVDILSPHSFRWLGRWDNIINTGGVKIIPEKVEKEIGIVFDKMGIANRFFIAGLPDDKLGNKVTLVIEGRLFSDRRTPVLKKLSDIITKFEMPREIKCVSKFVETATQKINRVATLNLIK